MGKKKDPPIYFYQKSLGRTFQITYEMGLEFIEEAAREGNGLLIIIKDKGYPASDENGHRLIRLKS